MQMKGWKNSAQAWDLSGKCALVLVPHQDDEINLAGSTILALKSRGCRVITAFLTLSDTGNNAHRRLKEALDSLACLGCPEKDVVFLGYGDSYNDGNHSRHLALQQDKDAVVPTWRGRTETDGLPGHPEWCFVRTGAHKTFTRRHVVEDIADLILTTRPDFIFGTGWDSHADHRALSLYLDEAMAQVLAGENND
ncbi:MAG: PIG-L family deacetylase, partial [Oscillospiraceae bacterium]|nr:PIG-L family deacetylase [Oscillospiraceae bacterium]